MAHQLLSSRWTGESNTPRRATGPQSSEAGCKGGKPRTRRGDPAQQVTMDNASEGTLGRRQVSPAYAGYPVHKTGRQAQKGTVSIRPPSKLGVWYPLERDPA